MDNKNTDCYIAMFAQSHLLTTWLSSSHSVKLRELDGSLLRLQELKDMGQRKPF